MADRRARTLERQELAALLEHPNILRIAMIDFRDGALFAHPVWY